MKDTRQTGQAILEMTIALVSLSFLILGILFMTGLCIGNVDLLLSARENADRASVNSNAGSAGNEVLNWTFDSYRKKDGEEVELRFMAKDRSIHTSDFSTGDVLTKMALDTDSGSTKPDDTEHYQQYQFVALENLPFNQGGEMLSEVLNTWSQGYQAASLVRGTPDEEQTEITTLNAAKSNGNFTADDVQRMEEAFARLFGTDPRQFDLKSAESNKVYMPAAILPGNSPN